MTAKRLAMVMIAMAGVPAIGWHFYKDSSTKQQVQEASRPHQVTITWEKSARAVSYNVYRSLYGANEEFAKLGTSTTPGYVDTTVQSGKRYCYVTTAIDSKGHESEKSKETCATVPRP